jgi:hypothetical protein
MLDGRMINFKDLELIGESDFTLHQHLDTVWCQPNLLFCGYLGAFPGQSGWNVILTI